MSGARVIAATSQRWGPALREGRFRPDLGINRRTLYRKLGEE